MAIPHSIELINRWFAKVHFTPDCWEWTGAQGSKGHGLFRVGQRVIGAHRVAYDWFIGEQPTGLDLDHLCCNPKCVNPKHLEPVTPGENLRRALVARTHCKRGHPFCEGNVRTSLDKNGKAYRWCNECHRMAMRRLNAKWNAIYAAKARTV